jgi:hypothetical protein
MSNFVIKKGATTWWPVSWAEPVDGGETVQCRIEMKFRRLSVEESKAGQPQPGDLGFIKWVAVDWRHITDDAGRAAPFDDETLIEMVARPAFMIAVGEAYNAFLLALPETRLGNSDPSPAGGPAAGAKTADQPDTATL